MMMHNMRPWRPIQINIIRIIIFKRNISVFSMESTVVVQKKDGGAEDAKAHSRSKKGVSTQSG